MSALPHRWLMSINFVPFNEPYFLYLCVFVISCLKLDIKYYNVATLKIIFSSSEFAVFDLKTTVIYLRNDFTTLIFQRLYSLSCVVTEGFVSLACFQISLNARSWKQSNTKQSNTKQKSINILRLTLCWAFFQHSEDMFTVLF